MAREHKAGLRLARAVRDQVEFQMACLDDLIGSEHRARQVMAYVEGLDLSLLYNEVRSVEGAPGQARTDPAILMAVWLYATLEGVGSARHLGRLIETDAAYRWLMGGVCTNHHTLSDFRTAAGPCLDAALSASIAALVTAGLVTLDALAVDGVRVRASAGKKSFKRKAKLQEQHQIATAHVAALKVELDLDPAASQTRVAARRKAAGDDRVARIEAALAAAGEIAQARVESAKKSRHKPPGDDDNGVSGGGPTASSTDPDARIMRMPDGGWRPAYNLQVSTDPQSGVMLGLEAIASGSDRGKLGPAAEQARRRYAAAPKRMLADAGYDSKSDIAAREAEGIAIYCPLPANDRPRAGEPEGVTLWRARMQSEAGAAVYARRFACERPHADMRNRGLHRFTVRGLRKVKAVALWFVHAHNCLTIARLKAA